MAKATLVTDDKQLGADILDALDRAGLGIDVALWAYLSDYEERRYVLSGKGLDRLGLYGNYKELYLALDRQTFPVHLLPAFHIFAMSDPFIKALRKGYARITEQTGITIGPHLFGNQFVEDGYIYRVR